MCGMAIVFFVAFLNAASCRLLIHCADRLSSSSSSASHSSPYASDAFAHLAYVTLGQWGVHLVHLSIVLTLCGAIAIYLITITTGATHFLPHISSLLVLAVLFLLLLPFAFLRDLSFLSFASVLGTASYAASFALIFAYGFSSSPSVSLPLEALSPRSSVSLLTTVGTLSFTLGIPVLTFAIAESMREPSQFTRVMDVTMAVIAVVFSCIGVLGVALFSVREVRESSVSPSIHHHGQQHVVRLLHQVQPIILSNLPASSVLSVLTQLLISVTLLLTAPLSLAPALNLLESIFAPRTPLPSAVVLPSTAAPSAAAEETAPLLVASHASHTPMYGGLVDHHDLYNHSSDEEEDSASAPAYTAKRGSVLVRGKVPSIASLDAITSSSPFTTSSVPSPARSPSSSSRNGIERASASASARASSAVPSMASALSSSALRVSALFAIFVVAFTVPCFTLIMACIGLFTLSILCFVLPPVFYLRLRRQQAVEGKPDDDGWWYAAYAWAFLATGVICMGAGAIVVSRMHCE